MTGTREEVWPDDDSPHRPRTDGDSPSRPATDGDSPSRRATITTTHADGTTARRVAAALRPDNTASMRTRVDGDRVVTAIARETTGGLRSTVDDYVVNATVAVQLSTDPDSSRDGSTTDNDNDT